MKIDVLAGFKKVGEALERKRAGGEADREVLFRRVKGVARCSTCGKETVCAFAPEYLVSHLLLCKACWKAEMRRRRNLGRQRYPWPKHSRVRTWRVESGVTVIYGSDFMPGVSVTYRETVPKIVPTTTPKQPK